MPTKALERAVKIAEGWPAAMQDHVADILLDYLELSNDIVELTSDDVEAIRLSREETARGEFMSDEDMKAIWARYEV